MTTEVHAGDVVFDGEHQTIGVVEDRPHPSHYVWVAEPLNGDVLVNEDYLTPYEAEKAERANWYGSDTEAALEQYRAELGAGGGL